MSLSSSDGAPGLYDEKQMKNIILKLLDKAGTDRRLTLRILRNKTEDKLKLERGTLKEKREAIKTLTYKWWRVTQTDTNGSSTSEEMKNKTLASSSSSTKEVSKNVSSSSNPSSTSASTAPKSTSSDNELKQLQLLAKSVGKSVFIKTMDDTLSEKAKCNKLRKKLRDLGLNFSDIPTASEIEKLKKEYEKMKDGIYYNSKNDTSSSASKVVDSSSNNKRKLSEVEKDTSTSLLKNSKSSTSQAPTATVKSSNGNSNSDLSTKVTATVKDAKSITHDNTVASKSAIAEADNADQTSKSKKRVIYDSDEEVGDF